MFPTKQLQYPVFSESPFLAHVSCYCVQETNKGTGPTVAPATAEKG